ncbi:MAG: 1-deoxy-D-xylulose-5-phosphate reductoisomerase [Gammaproteobacteria bacterium]|nr:MAG: 1-deoxy-D-xylulose-5-phosphate reductoisomerase [Gammaproteobacteria bacterium]
MSAPQAITILGATGSIGTQTLDVIARHPQHFSVFALSAHSNADLLFKQCQAYVPRYAVIGESAYAPLKLRFQQAGLSTQLLCGQQALADIACHQDVSQVVAGIVGGAGLRSIHAAVNAGKRLLLANKESLVMTGELLLQTAQKTGASILPLDSEHNALFQCLPSAQGFREKTLAEAGVAKLLLTGSGGPFRQTPLSELADKTPAEACCHPNWCMGRKISVDSATMMNKGLEYIEAKLLFAAQDSELDIIIHPQSIVHSLVQYRDGTSLAQIGHSDMRVPIAYALSYPKRISSGVGDIDLSQHTLSFESVDYRRYPCLKLAIDLANDNVKTTVMNAANEVAVAAFLAQKIQFGQIYRVVADCVTLDFEGITTINSVDDVLHLDAVARRAAKNSIEHQLNR